jgi:hypothetical protein
MEEDMFSIYTKLPKSILEIMDWICTTRFYKKTYLKRKGTWYEDVKEDWKFCDFKVIDGTLEKPKIIKIGEIPRYKGDHEKSIVINFNKRDCCYLIRGYATGLYASKVIQNNYPIPKYMEKELCSFIDKVVKEK